MREQKELSWMEEFLLRLCDNPADRAEVAEIVDTFRKLWRVAKAAEQNPYPRSPKLSEALASIKEPAQGKRTFGGAG